MAGSAVIGSLRVNLAMDTAAFQAGAKGAQASLANVAAKAKAAAVIISGAMVAGLGAAALGFKKTVDEADKLAKAAQSIGIPVEELSRLSHAADLSGVSFEGLTTAVARLSRNMSDVASGSGAEAKRAFDLLGISVQNTDGTLKSSSEVMTDVAAKFAAMEDGSAKTAIALQLFGRAGADLIPLLNSGADGLQALKDEADKLGIVIDTNTAQSAERFNDNLTRLGNVTEGILVQMTSGMLPAFEALSQRLVDAAMNTDVFKRIGEALGKVMEGVARAILFTIDNLDVFIRLAVAFIGVKIAVTVFELGRAFVALASAIRAAGLVSAGFNAIHAFTRRGLIATATIIALAAGQFEWLQQKVVELGSALQNMLPASVTEQVAGALDLLNFDTTALTAQFSQMTIASDAAGIALGERLSPVITNVAAATKTASEAKAEWNALQTEGNAVIESTLTPLQQAQAEYARLNDLLNRGAIDLKTYEAASGQVAANVVQYWGDATASLVGSFGEIAQVFGEKSSAMAKTAQILGAVQALIATFVGQAEALKLGFPQGLIAAATILAKGLAIVASIKSQSIPSFATGGSFMVGGQPGIDKNLVAMNLTRGERVDITPAGDAQRGMNRRSVEIIVKGKVFDRETIRDLLTQINGAIDDGSPLKARFA